ncbi:hypothetical protein JST97_03005 [bacterium]|nr:hypothetical protein [bacterium]
MAIARIQQGLDTVVERVAGRHPGVRVKRWSHSMGEANDLDGWALGFRLENLTFPIQCDLYFTQIHQKPILMEGTARWIGRREAPLEIWSASPFEDQHTLDFNALESSLDQAIARGPVPPDGVAVLLEMSSEIKLTEQGLEIREMLTEDESGVYQCWFRYLRRSNLKPLRICPYFGTKFHPHSSTQSRQLASWLGADWGQSAEALVGALFSGVHIPPRIQGPGLQIERGDHEWLRDFDWWKEFYAKEPRAHGVMAMSPVGLAGDQAALVISNRTGALPSGPESIQSVKQLGSGTFVAQFRRHGKGWVFQDLRKLPDAWLTKVLLQGELFLHFAARGMLSVVAYDGKQVGSRLHLRYEPVAGTPVELLLMDRGYLTSPRPPFQWTGNVVLLPFLMSSLIIPALEQAFVEF